MKILCLTDRELLNRIRGEVSQLNWHVEAPEQARHSASYASCASGFSPDLILIDARDQNMLNRLIGAGEPGERHFPAYDLHLDGERQLARVGLNVLALTLTEFRLLRELAFGAPGAVAREALGVAIFGAKPPKRRCLDVHVCSLRKKLKEAGITIQSVRNVGYRLSPCPA